jgi:hypothetical protein
MGWPSSHNVAKAAQDSTTEIVNTVVSKAKQAVSAKLQASQTMHLGHVNFGPNSEGNKIEQKFDASQVATVVAKSVDTAKMTNAATKALEQSQEVKVEGGLFGPDVNSDTRINVTSRAANATANYAVASAHAVANVDQTMFAEGVNFGPGSKNNALTQEANLVQSLTMSVAAVRDVTNMNDQAENVGQSNKTDAKNDTAVLGATFAAVSGQWAGVAGALGGTAMLLPVLLMVAVFGGAFMLLRGGGASAAGGLGVGGGAGLGALAGAAGGLAGAEDPIVAAAHAKNALYAAVCAVAASIFTVFTYMLFGGKYLAAVLMLAFLSFIPAHALYLWSLPPAEAAPEGQQVVANPAAMANAAASAAGDAAQQVVAGSKPGGMTAASTALERFPMAAPVPTGRAPVPSAPPKEEGQG